MSGILCIGYDVESGNPRVTRNFLKKLKKIHEDRSVPCTLFIKGQTLEQNVEQIRALVGNPLFDLEQHTYSHLIFKRITYTVDGEHYTAGKDEPVELIREEVTRTNQLFKDYFSIEIKGLTTPYAFYKGLMDRPDILAVLHDCGIRFIRSYGRNERSFNPVPLDVQPFFYKEQGFPDLLECPVQGWQDCIWRDRFGWKANWEKQVYMDLDYISEKGLYLGLVQHDWSSIKADKKMDKTAAIIDYALKRNLVIEHYLDFYKRMLSTGKSASSLQV